MLINMRNALMAGGAKPPAPPSEYWGLCFTAETAGATIAMAAVSTPPAVSLRTSTDGVRWTPFVVGGAPITLGHVGDRVYFSAGEDGNSAFASSTAKYNHFVITGGYVAASGSVMSLIDSSMDTLTIPEQSCFSCLFYGCDTLTSSPELPATELRTYCYRNMFLGCSSLVSAPELPATTGATGCYNSMFESCSSLRSAPELLFTALVTSCYNRMFFSCSSLDRIKVHHTQSWSTTYTRNWVSGVAHPGTFICPSALPHGSSDFGAYKIPTNWTVETF